MSNKLPGVANAGPETTFFFFFEFNYVHIDFLPAGYVYLWERGVEAANYDSGFIYFSSQFYQFLPHSIWALLGGT